MAKKEDQREQNLFWLNLTILKYAGIWNPFDRGFKKYLYHIYTAFVVFYVAENVFLIYVDCFQNLNDILVITTNLPIMITVSTNVIKLNYFLFNHSIVVELVERLNKGLFPREERFLLEVNQGKKKSVYLVATVVGIGLLTSVIVYIKSFLETISLENPEYLIYNNTEAFKPLLRARQWYPDSWWRYYGLVIIHGVVGIMGWGPPTDMGFDCLLVSILIQTSCQIGILQKQIGDYGKVQNCTDHQRYAILRKSIIFHQNIIRLVQDLQNLLGSFLFVQFLNSTAILGVAIYKFAVLADTAERIALIPYMLNMVLQLWFHCYFGEVVAFKCLELSDYAYLTPWEQYSSKYKYAIQFILFRAQRITYLRGGKFYIISLDTFRSILSASFSYYTLLKEMN